MSSLPPIDSQASSRPNLSFVALLREALSIFWRRLGLHLGINATLFGSFVLLCCVNACVAVPIVGIGIGLAGGPREDPNAMFAALMRPMLVVYGIALLLMSIAIAIHHGISLVVIRATRNGEDIRFVDALRSATSRGFAHAGTTLLRYGIDWVFGIPVLILYFRTYFPHGLVADPSERPNLSFQQHAILTLSYVLWLGWMVFTRAFDGLSNAAVQFEGLGPVDALRRSVELLRGHRLRVFAIRLGWSLAAFAVFTLFYSVPLWLAGHAGGAAGRSLVTALLVVYVPIVYFFSMLLVVIDTSLEVAIYDRLVPPRPKGESVAEIFA